MNRWRTILIMFSSYTLGSIVADVAGPRWWYLIGLIFGSIAVTLISFLEAEEKNEKQRAVLVELVKALKRLAQDFSLLREKYEKEV